MITTTEVALPKAEVHVAQAVVWKGQAGKFDARMGEISGGRTAEKHPDRSDHRRAGPKDLG